MYTKEFNAFYSVYPRNKGSKAKALQSFNKALKEVDSETIIRGAAAYAADIARNRTEIQFVAHASTFLNQRRWEIDFEPEPDAIKRAILDAYGATTGQGAGSGYSGDVIDADPDQSDDGKSYRNLLFTAYGSAENGCN